MASDELMQELERLRAEVQALREAQTEVTEVERPSQTEPQLPAVEGAGEEASLPAEAEEKVKAQLEELGALLQEEIRDLPTITCLTVFSLGILMGRLLR